MEREKNLTRLTDYHTTKKDTFYLHYFSFHRDLIAVINQYAKGNLLDIGCGNKPYENLFVGKIDKYIGCDVVQSSLNKVDVIAPANNIPLASNSFDTVLSTQVIEHVEDHQGLVNEAYRLLKPNGCFILSGPFTWPLHEEPYDFFRFTKHGFKYILENSGFEVISVQENGGAWANAGLSLIHALEGTEAKTFLMKCLLSLYHRLRLKRWINHFFGNADKNHFNEKNTINYVLVAKKKE